MWLFKNFIFYSIYLLGFIKAFEILSEYHQNDYDIKMDRCVVKWTNSSIYEYFKADFVPFNRTQRVLNYSFYVVENLTRNVSVYVQLYKFLSNEYRYFPITAFVNICEHYEKNSFKVIDLLKNTSNTYPCPWRKGLFYGYNILPDFSKFPPYIPRGQYQIELKVYHKNDLAVCVDIFGTVKDKPLKW